MAEHARDVVIEVFAIRCPPDPGFGSTRVSVDRTDPTRPTGLSGLRYRRIATGLPGDSTPDEVAALLAGLPDSSPADSSPTDRAPTDRTPTDRTRIDRARMDCAGGHGTRSVCAVLHSTSWRVAPDGGIVLTYVVAPDPVPTASAPHAVAAAIATGAHPTRPTPERVDHDQVASHAVRHLAFLLGTDGQAAAMLAADRALTDALTAITPAPAGNPTIAPTPGR